MLDMTILSSVRYIVDSHGKKSAIQLDIEEWNALLGYLEDLEDRSIIKEKIALLLQGPDKSEALRWEEAEEEW